MRTTWAALVLGAGSALGGGLVHPPGMQEPGTQGTAVEAELRAEVERLRAALAQAEASCQAQLAQMQAQLDRVNARRSEREYAWYQYNQALAQFRLDEKVPTFPLDPGVRAAGGRGGGRGRPGRGGRARRQPGPRARRARARDQDQSEALPPGGGDPRPGTCSRWAPSTAGRWARWCSVCWTTAAGWPGA